MPWLAIYRPLPQSSYVLRLLSVILLFTFGLIPGLRAQTFEETLGLQPSYLTLDEALQRVLEKSLDVRIEWLNWAIADAQTEGAWGKFEPAYFLSSTWRESNLPQNALEYAQTGGVFVPLDEPNMFKQQSSLTQTGFEGTLPLGTQYRLFASLGEFRNDLNRQRPPAIFYPEYAAAVGVTLIQPLLRGFGPSVNLAEVRISRRNEAIADHQWEARLQRSIAQVMLEYYDLIFALENLSVKRDVVIFAQNLVTENQKRLDAGLLSPADVQEAEVAVAISKEDVIASLSFAVEKQRSIKGQILGSLEEGAGLIFLPRDSLPIISPRTDRAQLLQTALARRPDHRAAIEEAEKQAIVVKYTRNQLLPRLDLQATLTANGLSGSRSDAYERAFDRQGYDTQVGFQFSIPLGNRTAKASSEVAEHRERQAILNIARSELNVSVEIDSIIAQVKAAKAKLDSTRDSVRLSERLLDTEQKRLGEGVARTFDVLKARREMADASTRQIAALAEYNKAATQLALVSGTLLERQGIRIDRGSRQPQAVKDKR